MRWRGDDRHGPQHRGARARDAAATPRALRHLSAHRHQPSRTPEARSESHGSGGGVQQRRGSEGARGMARLHRRGEGDGAADVGTRLVHGHARSRPREAASRAGLSAHGSAALTPRRDARREPCISGYGEHAHDLGSVAADILRAPPWPHEPRRHVRGERIPVHARPGGSEPGRR